MDHLNRVSIIGIVFFFILVSCQKDENSDNSTPCVEVEGNYTQDTSFYIYDKGSQEKGFVKGIKSNKEWEGSAFAKIENDMIIIFFKTFLIPNSTYDAEYVEIKNIPKSTGCYLVSADCDQVKDDEKCVESFFIALDDDSIEDYYIVDDESLLNNRLEIESLDLGNMVVKGKLSVTYTIDDGIPNRSYNPLYLRLFNIDFDIQIE